MDVARPILDAQDMRRFRQVRHNRVVARHLPVMRIGPPARPLDLQAGRDDRAIDIDRRVRNA
jgi:hypothetical protein